MKLGSVTKLDKRNTTVSKKIDDDVMLANCEVIVFFPIYVQFAAIRKPDFGRMVYKTYIFINSNFLSRRTWKQNCKISNTALILLLWVKVLFLPKNTDFLHKKKACTSRIKGVLVLKGIFLKLHMCVYLRTKFQVFGIILTRFRQDRWGVNVTTPTARQTLKSPPWLGLTFPQYTLVLEKLNNDNFFFGFYNWRHN